MDHAVRKLARLVDSSDQTQVRRPQPAKRMAAPTRRFSAPAASGLRSLKSGVSKPVAFQHTSPKPAPDGDTPTDAQFLASFEEM
jgi:hypothetical protein